MKLLIIFIYLIITNFSYASEKPNIRNLILIKNPETYDDVTFRDTNQKNINLDDFRGKLVLFNFWATWCVPCKDEMPSLDNLQSNSDFKDLKIFPINMGKENVSKMELFFKELNVRNLDIFIDAPATLAKKFSLRGIPTTILFNKEGKEFARIVGSTDFDNEEFIDWLKNYD
ncbi:thiol-disulfide isomerase/thioredoxin [Candidatus Pelagibacter ubique]|uniref:Thiol-disulfide isomerase/thioredoxin n=1 Tax=Pelagibacter ubique TaxID=198252 RepID=A0ABX1T2X1_PELUQ|nr:TlpA disulfide reductase family protein [Candidatus Pelagibacter ubique]NMN67221.1 thiol-disulfide isomerase/thioredoxin [Candidatus Pelagibacter ubique]